MSAREALYVALMVGGPHSPERSEWASARIDAYRAEVLAEEAGALIAACPEHSKADETWMDCPCEYAGELRRRATVHATEATS